MHRLCGRCRMVHYAALNAPYGTFINCLKSLLSPRLWMWGGVCGARPLLPGEKGWG